MKFSKALEELEAGKKVRRSGWRETLCLDIFTDCDSNTGYKRSLVLFDDGKYLCEWKPVDSEILADDWEVALPEVVCDIIVKCPKCKQEIHLFDEEKYEILNCPCGFQYKPVKPKRKNNGSLSKEQ